VVGGDLDGAARPAGQGDDAVGTVEQVVVLVDAALEVAGGPLQDRGRLVGDDDALGAVAQHGVVSLLGSGGSGAPAPTDAGTDRGTVKPEAGAGAGRHAADQAATS
jgi:hypothetical protein